MPLYLSKAVFKQQAKLIVQHWPFTSISHVSARNLLAQLYGYQNDHHYQQLINSPTSSLLQACTEATVLENYQNWTKTLSHLGGINQIQARKLIHQLWPAFLNHRISLTNKLYHASFSFYGQCVDFLHDALKNTCVEYEFDDTPAIIDAIQALGVPHTDIGDIKVNGQPVDFGYRLADGDKISVYSADFSNNSLIFPQRPAGQLTFLLDVHLGGLARYLRMAGINCLYETNDYGDAVLAEVAATQNYILLTRDIGLLKRSRVKYGRWIRATKPLEQFKEIISHYQLASELKPFSCCIKCNGEVLSVTKASIKTQVPEGIFNRITEFTQCCDCKQVYWQGDHFNKMKKILTKVRSCNK